MNTSLSSVLCHLGSRLCCPFSFLLSEISRVHFTDGSDLSVMAWPSRMLSTSFHCTVRAPNWASRDGKAQYPSFGRPDCTDSLNTMQEHEAETNLLWLSSVS